MTVFEISRTRFILVAILAEGPIGISRVSAFPKGKVRLQGLRPCQSALGVGALSSLFERWARALNMVACPQWIIGALAVIRG